MRGILDGCENPKGCRKVAIKRIQFGHMDDGVVDVEADMKLCAYCAADFEENYREENPDGFVREVPEDQ